MKRKALDEIITRLAEPFNNWMSQLHAGIITNKEFMDGIQPELTTQHKWLRHKGLNGFDAAAVIHAAMIVLKLPALRAEAHARQKPLELLEMRDITRAADDLTSKHTVDRGYAMDFVSGMVAEGDPGPDYSTN